MIKQVNGRKQPALISNVSVWGVMSLLHRCAKDGDRYMTCCIWCALGVYPCLVIRGAYDIYICWCGKWYIMCVVG